LALADDKVIGERRLLADVDDDRVPSLPVGGGFLEQARELQRRQPRARPGQISPDYARYSRAEAMYRSTACGTSPEMLRPSRTASRISLAETAGVDLSHTTTRSPCSGEVLRLRRPAAGPRHDDDRRERDHLLRAVPAPKQRGGVPAEDEEQLG